ncbi:MAG: hypothetical protein IKD10_13490, partial [Lentisphaeria bacterium]|nr:hypothetical protein [Lentisphaeria bacterium]
DLEEHLKVSNPEATNNKIDRLRGDVNLLRDAVERDRERRADFDKEISRVLGELSGAINGINKWLDNTNVSVQEHITNGEIHCHGK